MNRDYYDIPKIDIYSIFNQTQNTNEFKTLEKLGIRIEDKLYTEYEFECLRVDVAEYYEKEDKLPKDVTKEDYAKLREILDNVEY